MEWVRLSPAMTASYSASLLEAWKPNLRAYSTYIPSREVRIRLALLPWALAAPSTDNLQMGRSGVSWVASVDSIGVNSMMKSARICSFTAVLGLYLMSNSLISIAHFINLPEVSSLCSINARISFYLRVPLICSPQSSDVIID